MLNKADEDFTIILNEYDENGEKIVEHRFKSEQMYWNIMNYSKQSRE